MSLFSYNFTVLVNTFSNDSNSISPKFVKQLSRLGDCNIRFSIFSFVKI